MGAREAFDDVVRLDQRAGTVVIHRIDAFQLGQLGMPLRVVRLKLLPTSVRAQHLEGFRQLSDVTPVDSFDLVDLGTVESLELTPDMSRVIVHARMKRAATEHLTENARFAIIAPRVGVGGISGLSTIVSGSYIEMYPGKDGEPKRDFVGLDEPPALPPDTRGRSFTLSTNDLGSLTRGSPISYRGVNIGEVEGYVENKRLKFYLNRWRNTQHDPKATPNTQQMYEIMLEADAEETTDDAP